MKLLQRIVQRFLDTEPPLSEEQTAYLSLIMKGATVSREVSDRIEDELIKEYEDML